MDEYEPRPFADGAAVRRVGEGLVARTLPRAEWTHEAHLAACAWIVLERPEIVPERDLPGLIRRYNESVGGVNSDSEGYHETITQMYIRGVRAALARTEGRGGARAAAQGHEGDALLVQFAEVGVRRQPGIEDELLRDVSRGLEPPPPAPGARLAPKIGH
jgi:hypothetical protein